MPLGAYMLGTGAVLVGDLPDGSGRGPIGTSFFVRVPSDSNGTGSPDSFYGYLITCHHVVEGQNDLELKIPNIADPTTYYPTIDAPEFRHVEGFERLDLALAEFLPPAGCTVTALQLGWNVLPLVTSGLLGVTFHYVGYLAPLDLVMARSGTLGRVDEMLLDPPEYEYRTHIGDVRSYGGFSGSPCFIEYPLPTLTPKENPFPQKVGTDGDDEESPVGRTGYVHLLCGMFTGHLEPNRFGAGGDLASRQGVGFILSSDEIIDVLMSDKLRQERREKDETNAPDDVRSRTTISDSGTSEVF